MDTQGPSLSTVARGMGGGRYSRSPEVGLGVLPSLPSPRLPVPPVITGSPSSRAHAQAHTHLRPFQQAVLPPGGQVRTSALGSCQSLPSPLFWMPGLWPQGLQPLGLWSPNLPPPSVTKQVHSSIKQQRCGINVPVFCNHFLWGLTNPGRGSETCGLAQVPASWWQTRPYPPGSHFPPPPTASPLRPLGG